MFWMRNKENSFPIRTLIWRSEIWSQLIWILIHFLKIAYIFLIKVIGTVLYKLAPLIKIQMFLTCSSYDLTFNAPIATKVVCFAHLLKSLRRLYGKQCGPPIGAVCSESTLFASIPNLSAMLGNSLHQTTSADGIFRCICSWRFKG